MEEPKENLPDLEFEARFAPLDAEAKSLQDLVQQCIDATPKDLDETQRKRRSAEINNLRVVVHSYLNLRSLGELVLEDEQDLKMDFAEARQRLTALLQNPRSAGKTENL